MRNLNKSKNKEVITTETNKYQREISIRKKGIMKIQNWIENQKFGKRQNFVILILLMFGFLIPQGPSPVWAQTSDCVEDEVKIGSVTYSSIRSAVSAAEAGDTITIGSGVFSENVDVRNKNNLTLSSECSPEIQKIRARSVNGLVLKGLSIRTPDDVRGSALHLKNVQNVRVENTHVLNSAHKGIEVDGNSTNVLFTNVFVYHNEEGFSLGDGVGVTIQGLSGFMETEAMGYL